MVVHLQLVENRNTDTVDAIQYLLQQAEKGNLSVSAMYSRPGEKEEALLTGVYRVHPELAVMAALRLTTALLRAKEEESKP